MGYWGTLVLAHSDTSITDQPEINAFGQRHHLLRDLGGGWQLLETSRPEDDPQDLAAATRSWSQARGSAALAAYVCDSDCAGVYAAAPGRPAWSVHLPDPTQGCTAYRHVPPVNEGTAANHACQLATAWARTAGLSPSEAHLRWVMSPSPASANHRYVSADDLVFELVLALGIPAIVPSRPSTLDPQAPPFNLVTDQLGGLGRIALEEVAQRRENPRPLDDWTVDAIRLYDRIWAATFVDADQASELAKAVEQVRAGYLSCRAASGPPPAHIIVNGRPVRNPLRMADAMHRAVAEERLNAPNPLFSSLFADTRAEEHPIRRAPQP
jgi:hypothetical protein